MSIRSVVRSVDPLRTSLAGFIVISISTVHAYIGVLRVLRIGALLWLASVAFVLLLPKGVRWGNLFRTWPAKAVLLLALIACVGVPFGLSIGASGLFLLNVYLRIVALFIMLVVALRSVRDLRLFVWAFVASAAVLAVMSFTVMEIAPEGGGRLESEVMYDANDLGLIFLTAMPLGLLLWQASKGRARWIAAAATCAIAAAVAMTGSRGAFVGFLAVIPALFLGVREVPIHKRSGIIAVLVAGLIFAAPDGYWDRVATIFNPSQDYNVTESYGRVEIAKRGLGYMLSRPLFGLGIVNFARAEVTISPLARNAMFGEAVRYIAPHNTYIQVGAELGLPALLLWLSVLYQGTVGVWRRGKRFRRRRDRAGDERFLSLMHTYLPISFLGFATTSFFVSHAYTPVFYIITAFLAGTLMFHAPERAVRVRSPRAARRAGNGLRSGSAVVSH